MDQFRFSVSRKLPPNVSLVHHGTDKEALRELLELKQLKFNDGEYPSEEYSKRKPIAWENARKVLEKALT